ncbi:MAG TPA: response regulator transcription factor [Steroidobacteraceae bacterium]|jgi:DNA-binding response OmpR family regulator
MSLLLVEDDERVSRFVVRGLAAEGHAVAVASNAPQGLAMARAEPFDVLILDVMLPGYSGKDLCQRLRASGIGSPILMLTALDAVEDKVDGLRSGADDYLTKPFDFEELLARVEALIRRAKGTPVEPVRVLQAADVTLDRESMSVHRQGRLIELTAKEFQLLDLLMSSPGKVMSRTRILNKVWNHDSDPLTNVVDVYIRRLRTKLGLDPDRGLIRTLRGYGYKLDPTRQCD